MSQISARQNLYSKNRRSLFHGFDPVLSIVVGLLLFLGTLLVWAATRDWYARSGLDPQYYLKRHVFNILIGAVLAYGVTVWIALPGGFQIQPAELAKVGIIIGMAMILSERSHDSDKPSNKNVLQSLGVAALPVLLIVLQPDMGTILIIAASVVTMIAVSGASSKWVVGLLLLAVSGGFIAVQAGIVSEYQVKRLQTFVDPNADTQGSGYQLRQARITVGSGGLLGTGLFNGPQTSGRFVPEQQTDFIFTVAGEQLGFVGSGTILVLYLILLMRAFSIARRTNDPFGRLVCTGVIAWFAFQMFENIGMTLGMMPMTGVPLPFISYGGSSMFATLIGFGLLQNVHARLRG